MKNRVVEYLNKKFGKPFEIVSYEERGSKDIIVELDFGDDELTEVVIRHRAGDNGNFRITSIAW